MADTSAPLSEVAVATMAANLLDDYRIASLDDDTPLSRFMAREFGYVRDECLQSYPWHFAVKRAALPVDNEAPAFGWTYRYTVPSDCIRLLPLRKDGAWRGDEVPYELESRKILCDVSAPLKIRYIRRVTNIAEWSPLAARAFATRLALYSATRVTGKNTYYQKCFQALKDVMWEATQNDSLERGTNEGYTQGINSLTIRNGGGQVTLE